MSRVSTRLAAFAAGLAVIFAAAAAVGAKVQPSHPRAAASHGAMSAMASAALGLGLSDGQYTLTPATFAATPAGRTTLRFRIADAHGHVVRDGFEVEAQRRLHLILVRRDLRGYQHLHPRQSPDGTWSVPVTLERPGVYRVFTDFQIDGTKHVLAADLTAAGGYTPSALPSPSTTAGVAGYTVRLATPALRAGREADLRFAVSRGGRAVASLQPYLGALGHLVALRQGDLGYLHVHPHDDTDQVGAIPFAATFPSAGSYRLFLQFQTNGRVHTTSFTVKVAP